ncbi:hypothetical protein SAMN04488097_0682 [Epilithonimonas lactis]|nr:hypothetical protein SAMN04488097_0682 [Epilithonimonas lactis]
MTKPCIYLGSAARLEWSSFFALGKALAKKSGNGRRKSCPNYNNFLTVLDGSYW